MQIAALTARVLGLEGPDAETFLQSLVTADILGLAEGEARYAALLTPQGKILFDFFVVKTARRLLLDCAASQLEELHEAARCFTGCGRRSTIARARRFGSRRLAGATAPGLICRSADPRTLGLSGGGSIAETARCQRAPAMTLRALRSGLPTAMAISGRASSFPMRPISISWGR